MTMMHSSPLYLKRRTPTDTLTRSPHLLFSPLSHHQHLLTPPPSLPPYSSCNFCKIPTNQHSHESTMTSFSAAAAAGGGGFSPFLLILFAFSSTQLRICEAAAAAAAQGIASVQSYITWEDMRIQENFYMGNLMDHSGPENSTNSSSRVIVVRKDGTGDSVTVQGAIDLIPHQNPRRVKIFIFPGVYSERVIVPKTKPYISFIGNQSSETVITWHSKASDRTSNGQVTGTFNTATVDIESDYFCATGITVKNTVEAVPGGKGMQAVALRIAGDKSMFYRVNIIGSQDTLLDLSGTHYLYNCYIQGSIDFIFGNGRSLYEECTLHSTAIGSGAIAASHRNSAAEKTGFSFVKCTVKGSGMIYLGRAWGRYSRAVYSLCDFDSVINPTGWSDWGDPSRRGTVWFGEYKCRGRGADVSGRVAWSKTFSNEEEARPFLDRNFIDGDQWLRL